MKILSVKIKNDIAMTMSLNKGYLRKKWKPRKLGERTSGPYRVLQTHVNGTLMIELRQGVSERINIRRVIPYREPG